MEEKEKNRILSRVRKMLALANDAGATEGERDNAMRMAHATLAKYNLDLASAEASGKRNDDEPRGSHEATFYGRPWARQVCKSAADLFFCEYVYTGATKGKDTRHYFIGRESNSITAAEMAQYLVESIAREARRAARDAYAGNTYLRSFALGAAARIRERVREIIAASRSQASSGPGTAIVLASLYDLERVRNSQEIAVRFPKLQRGKGGRGCGSWDAHAQGRIFGGTVSLQKQIR